MRYLCNSLLLCGIVFFWVPAAANAQVATPKLLLAPVDWRFEAMPLPPRFAPKIKWTGFEEIRFAPGVFDNSSPNYFSYVIALSVNGTSAIDAAGIKDFLETYFRGLLPGVGQRKGLTVNASQIAAQIAPAQTQPKTNARCQGTVAIIDTFTDGRKTTLNVEADILPQEALKKTYVLLLLSPQARDSKIWKTLRGIRDKTIASSAMATAIPAATSRIPVAAASAVSVDPALQQRIDRLIQEKISLTHRGKWDERDERIGDIGVELCLIGEPAIEPLINVIKRARKSRHTFENEAVARLKISIVLGRMGEPAVEPLLELLNNRDPRRTWFKYHTLVKLNRQGIQPLLYLLKNGDPESKRAAAGLLPLLGYRETIEPLIEALKDRDNNVRRTAATSLERIKHTEILISQLESDNVMIRRYAARAISDWKSRVRSTREPLEKAMQDEDVLVRRAAAESLYVYHMPFPDLHSVRPLSIALNDPDSIVREKASNGLSRIRGQSNPIEFDRLLEGKEPLTEEDESVTGQAAHKASREELAKISKALNDYSVQRRKDKAADITKYKNALKRSRITKTRVEAAESF
jgi:HEAT repeat protein